FFNSTIERLVNALRRAGGRVANANAASETLIPVALPLSRWSNKQEFLDWAASEIESGYLCDKQVARYLITQQKIILFLDGLDEVEAGKRQECIQAINGFIRQAKSLVVCSRFEEYKELKPAKLKVNTAVRLMPLEREQISAYLAQSDTTNDALRQALAQDATLAELARSPLMLSDLRLLYQDNTNINLAG